MSLDKYIGTDTVSSSSSESHNHPVILDAGQEGDLITVPNGEFLLTATYSQQGSDLVLSGAGGPDIIITDFFAQTSLPSLATEGGAWIQGPLAAKLSGAFTDGAYAQAGVNRVSLGVQAMEDSAMAVGRIALGTRLGASAESAGPEIHRAIPSNPATANSTGKSIVPQ